MRLLREPLLHFLLIGAAIFLLYGRLPGGVPTAPQEIRVTQAAIDHLTAGFAATWQRPPSPPELDGLLRDYVREEAAYREALALGLDKNDTIVRRRLRQKLEFLSQTEADTEPTDDQLRQHLGQHPEVFTQPGRVTFRQVFLDPRRHGDQLAADAARLLDRLRSEPQLDPNGVGDPWLLNDRFDGLTIAEVAKQFGEQFASTLPRLALGEWQGPIASGYGVHLVLLEARSPDRLPALDEVRDAVRRDWQAARVTAANERFYRELLDRYVVTVETPAAKSTLAVVASQHTPAVPLTAAVPAP